MKRWLILFMVGCLAVAGTANAAVQQGDTELDALGSWMMQNGEGDNDDIDVLQMSAGIGYFVTDNFQIQGAAMFSMIETDGADFDIWSIGARGKYHFMPTNQWVPYIGGQVMWANFDADDEDGDGVLWGPLLGLRYELNAYNDFFVEYQYHMWTGDIDEVIDDGHGLFVGLIHQFK